MSAPIPPGRKTVAIRWRDLDGFNHVNNAVFLNYLEEGRDAWLANALGDGEPTMNEFVVRHIAIDFVSQLTQEDGAVEVVVEVEKVGGSSITLRETITALSDGRVAARVPARKPDIARRSRVSRSRCESGQTICLRPSRMTDTVVPTAAAGAEDCSQRRAFAEVCTRQLP